MTKKLISLFLSLVMILGTMSCAMISASANQSMYQNFNTNYTLTGDGASDMVAIARAQIGRQQSQFGYTEGWCDNFISDCAIRAGQASAVPQGGDVNDFLNKLINAGATYVSSPRAGDIVIFKSGSSCTHAALMQDNSNCINGNFWTSGYSQVEVYPYSTVDSYNGWTHVFVRPNYKKTTTDTPSVTYTSITEGKYTLKNVQNGQYLHVAYGNDENGTIIHTSADFYENSDVYNIIKASNGYKLRPLCSSKRVVSAWGGAPGDGAEIKLYDDSNNNTQCWKFEKVSNGYVLHLAYNENLVLTQQNGKVFLSQYTTDSTWQKYQTWQLVSYSQHTHSYGSWVTQKEPTCTETGLRYKTCSCGDKITETIPALGHSFGSWIVEREATYYSEGLKIRTCSRCSTTESQIIPMIEYVPQPDENISNVRIELSDNYLGIGDTFTASVYAPTNIGEAEVSLSLESNCFEGMWIDNQNGGLLSREEYGGIVTYEYKGCINPVDDGSKETLLFTITFKTIQTGPMLASCSNAYDRDGNSIDIYSDYQMLFVPESDPEEPIAIELDRDTVNVGETVKASVIISTGYTGYDLLLNYDTDCFELVSAQEENLGFCFIQAINDGTAGEIKLAGARTRLTSTKVLLTAEFKVLKEGTLELDCLDLLDDEDNSIDASSAYANVYVNTNTDPGPDIQPTDSLAGDANNDNKISVVDAKWVLQNLASLRDFDDNQKAIADVNGDGKLSVVDAKWILQAVAGIRELGGGVAPQPQPEPEPEPPIVDGDIVIEAYRTEINSPVELSGKNVIRYPKINVSTSNIEAFNQKIANDFDEVYQYYMSDYANNNYSLYYDYIFSETDGYVSIQVLAEIVLAASEDFSYAVFQYYYDLNNDCEIDYDTYLLKVGNDEENVFEAVCSYIEDEYGSSVLDYAYPEFLGAIFIDNQLKVFVSYYEYDEEFGYYESAKSFVFEDYDILNSEYFYDYFSYCI